MQDDIRKWAHERARYRPAPDIYEAALLDLAQIVEAARGVYVSAHDPARIDPSVGVFLVEPSAESVVALAAALRALDVPGVE